MKQLFAYIRVSDAKQVNGVSLTEQRSLIEAYAARIGVVIIEWFVEQRTAARTGRPVFDRMVQLVRAGSAQGFIVHKLDRSTRNWYDWAEVNALLDRGVDIHVAHENLDLRSRGGRLAADMQIVIAVDYIRNLREEALKGIEGRLKQGVLPNAAGIGYLDCGAGKPKEIDPKKGPLVRCLFELYATGAYTLRDLTGEAKRLGLRNRNGRPLWMQEIHKVLRNPFYAGLIRSKRFGIFQGAHVPLVSRALFDRVQAILTGKVVRRTKRYSFRFRRLIHCRTCSRSLIASERKGWVYYRCSTMTCPTTSIREDRIEAMLRTELEELTFSENEALVLEAQIKQQDADAIAVLASRTQALRDSLAALNARLARLTDLLLDGKIDSQAHDEKRFSLIAERQRIEEELGSLAAGEINLTERLESVVGLAKAASALYELADATQRRQLIEMVMSDCIADGKTIVFIMREPFATIAKRHAQQIGGPLYDTPRTLSVETLVSLAATLPASIADVLQSISLEETVKTPPPAA